jgi:putative colanic acid biosynthesis UDP-glucose lipid carrier transferase
VALRSPVAGMKRLLDFLVALVALYVLTLPMLAIALWIKVDSPGPVLFRQVRVGRWGNLFHIWKFRTMVADAPARGLAVTAAGDPRITRAGRLLRATKLDELPQLFNVLRGDMSLIGPRPHALAHDNLYVTLIEDYAYRQHVKPGLTGWAQVNGCRGETKTVDAMAARVEHDLWYIDHWSLLLDLRIILRTIGIVLFDRNAY